MLAGEHQQQQLLAASAAPAALLLEGAADLASSSGGGPPSSTEIELEFDREVYPIGVSLADASIVGVTQRVLRPAVGAGLLQVSWYSGWLLLLVHWHSGCTAAQHV
jgi:hypothetical protein